MKKVLFVSTILSALLYANTNAVESQYSKVEVKTTPANVKLIKETNPNNLYQKNSFSSSDFESKKAMSNLIIDYERLKNDNLLLAQRVHDLELALKNIDISTLDEFSSFMKEQKKRNKECDCYKKPKVKKIANKPKKTQATKQQSNNNQQQNLLKLNNNKQTECSKIEYVNVVEESGAVNIDKSISVYDSPSKEAKIVKVLPANSQITFIRKAISSDNETFLQINENNWINAKNVEIINNAENNTSKTSKIINEIINSKGE